jgi:hypothetical protein
MEWLATVGTNELLKGIWANNWIALSFIGAVAGSFIKGRWPAFFDNLKTALPFVGNPKKF